MIKVFILCAIMPAGAQCLPFKGLAPCLAAEGWLTTQLVEISSCSEAEIRLGSRFAPERSPVPLARPASV